MELDISKIVTELGIGKEVVVELLNEYLKESEVLLTKLGVAIASGDYAVMISTAHTLKGSAGNLRMTPIQDTARGIEMAAKEKKDKATMEPQVVALKALHEELRTILGNVS